MNNRHFKVTVLVRYSGEEYSEIVSAYNEKSPVKIAMAHVEQRFGDDSMFMYIHSVEEVES